jgi:hypothetical protein
VAEGADVDARDLSGAQALTHAARGKLADGGAVRLPPWGLAARCLARDARGTPTAEGGGGRA